LITVLLVLTLVAGLVARHLLRIPSQSLLEAAPVLMLWLALIGASLALGQRRHIRLELLMRFAPEGGRVLARLWVGLFGAATMGLLGWSALHFVRDEIALFGPKGWAAAIFPLFFAVATLRCLLQAAAARTDAEKRA
jgi:TRAP-type C4-dicarboxylate transport system permease small subunit